MEQTPVYHPSHLHIPPSLLRDNSYLSCKIILIVSITARDKGKPYLPPRSLLIHFERVHIDGVTSLQVALRRRYFLLA